MERVLGDGCLGGHPPTFVPAANAISGWRLSERCRNAKWLESTGESQLAQPAARREKFEPVGQGDSHWPASYYQDRQLHCWRSSRGRLPVFDRVIQALQLAKFTKQECPKKSGYVSVSLFCHTMLHRWWIATY